MIKMLNKILSFFNFKKENKRKITNYDVFIQNVKDTMNLNVDFRAEYKTEEINVIINPFKQIRTPKKAKKEPLELEEVNENEQID